MFRNLVRFVLAIVTSIQFSVNPALAMENTSTETLQSIATVGDSVNDLGSLINFFGAATGNDKFATELADFFSAQKVDLRAALPSMKVSGQRIYIETLPEAISIANVANQYTYKGVTFTYNPSRSVTQNYAEMKASWGQFKEFGFGTVNGVNWKMGNYAHAISDVAPLFMVLAYVALAPLIIKAAAVAAAVTIAYVGYQWFKNKTEPFQMQCQGNKIVQSKGDDKLVLEVDSKGQEKFYTLIEGKKELEGSFRSVELRNKNSKMIADGNKAVQSLNTSDAALLNKRLNAMRALCANPAEVEKFNASTRRVQNNINDGRIKVKPAFTATESKATKGKVVPGSR